MRNWQYLTQAIDNDYITEISFCDPGLEPNLMTIQRSQNDSEQLDAKVVFPDKIKANYCVTQEMIDSIKFTAVEMKNGIPDWIKVNSDSLELETELLPNNLNWQAPVKLTFSADG